MNERTQYEIDETRRRLFERDLWRCRYPGCLENCTELAHRIGQGKMMVKHIQRLLRYDFGELWDAETVRRLIIHNDKNMASSCRKHNSYFDISNCEEAVRVLLAEIYQEVIEDENKRPFESIGETQKRGRPRTRPTITTNKR